MSPAHLRKGWCPGALRPMPSGDGLLVRLRLTAGELPAAKAIAIAALAQRHGNGAIELTQRANLQLRGVREAGLPALTAGLSGLGLLDDSPEAEAVRNVLVSPLAGLDPSCADGRGLARQLEVRLAREPELHGLPAKFGFAIDGGGRWPLGDSGADVTLFAQSAAMPWRVRLAGSDVGSAAIAPERTVGVLIALAHAFLGHRLPRMRDLVSRDGAAAVLAAAGVGVDARLWLPTAARAACGALQLAPGQVIAAIGLPFGHIEAAHLAQVTAAPGTDVGLRLTPWRLLLVAIPDTAAASRLLDLAAALGLAVAPADRRLMIEACTGAPLCANATTRTREDAARLLDLIGPGSASGIGLHVSGCAKGCAHRGSARVTLVAHQGRYDLILNGGTADPPFRTGLAADELRQAMAQLPGQTGGSR